MKVSVQGLLEKSYRVTRLAADDDGSVVTGYIRREVERLMTSGVVGCSFMFLNSSTSSEDYQPPYNRIHPFDRLETART